MSTALTDSDKAPVVVLPPPSLLPPYAIPASTATGTFESFPKLPIEVRRMIWKFTIVPRTVEVRFAKPDGEHLDHDFISDTPALLHVCAEAREEGLRSYTAQLKTEHSHNQMYFNFDLDTLSLRRFGETLAAADLPMIDNQINSFASALPHKDRIQRLIVPPELLRSFGISEGIPVLLQFTSLEEVGLSIPSIMNDEELKLYERGGYQLIPQRPCFIGDFQLLSLWVCRNHGASAEITQETMAELRDLAGKVQEKCENVLKALKARHPQIQWVLPRLSLWE